MQSRIAAMAGSDYINDSSIEVFPSGSTDGVSRCLDITILDDDAIEGNQTFNVTVTTLDPDVLLWAYVTTVTITGNDG